ncbi:MAG: ArsR/SmtB family transcription factor [Alphaproteobacteria bacterium]
MAYDTVIDALADPTRRLVLERLRGGPASVGEIARTLPVSRPAVSQHLKVLKTAALVRERRQGTRHIYSIRTEGLEDLRRWLDGFWDEALDAFATALEQEQNSRTEEDTT